MEPTVHAASPAALAGTLTDTAAGEITFVGELTATAEQVAYAKLLDKGMRFGLMMTIVSFAIYVIGTLFPISFMTSHVPVNDLPHYWSMPVHEYLKAANVPDGWSWLGMIGKIDVMNFIGIAFLAGITIVCYLRIIPIIWRQRDYTFTAIAVLEVLVLALAASGILKSGAH